MITTTIMISKTHNWQVFSQTFLALINSHVGSSWQRKACLGPGYFLPSFRTLKRQIGIFFLQKKGNLKEKMRWHLCENVTFKACIADANLTSLLILHLPKRKRIGKNLQTGGDVIELWHRPRFPRLPRKQARGI